MAERVRAIMNLIGTICREENLRVTVSGSLRNGVGGFIGGVVGGLVGGPLGGVPGAAIGAGIAAASGKDFKPLHQVIAEWSDETKQQLAHNIESIMQQVNAQDVAAFAAMAAGAAPAVRAQVVAAVVGYCQNEMGLQVAA